MGKMSYEKAALRLEEITEKLESGNLPLEEMLKLYEEGTRLASDCSKELEKVKVRITELSGKKDGE